MDKKLTKIVLLHSNDIHADILSSKDSGCDVGGLALLSGYLQKVRAEEENVIYVIAGDMLNGSVLDSEYLGQTTMVMINRLAPDAVCLGNHEVDYGISHTLLLERMCDFPLINTNIYLKLINKRLYQPFTYVERGGKRFLFAGMITEQVAGTLKNDPQVGKYVEVRNPIEEIAGTLEKYIAPDVDVAVVLSHIGLEEDVKLAHRLGTDMGVDMIIGGHSHDVLEQPIFVNTIAIAQAGYGTSQIGRFDLYFDAETGAYDHYEYRIDPITEETCTPDPEMTEYIRKIKHEVDLKYEHELCQIPRQLEMAVYNRQTELGSFVAEAFRDALDVDVHFVRSSQFRSQELGPVVTLKHLTEAYPYINPLVKVQATGAQLWEMMDYMMSAVDPENEDSVMVQVSSGIQAQYSQALRRLVSLTLHGLPLDPDQLYTLSMSKYAFMDMKKSFGFSSDVLTANGPARIIALDDRQVLVDYLVNRGTFELPEDIRLIMV